MQIFQIQFLILLYSGLVDALPSEQRALRPSIASARIAPNLIQEVYCREPNGKFKVYRNGGKNPVPAPDLVIANGGGGQSGMIEYLAKKFLMQLETGSSPICVGWWASNTHGSHEAMRSGQADLAVVYDIERIKEAVKKNEVTPDPEHIWMDRFAFIGPKGSNLISDRDSTETFASKIMETPGAYFLTRVDKSTAHNRESKLFAKMVTKKRKFFYLPRLSESDVLDLMAYQGWESMPENLQKKSQISYSQREIKKFQAMMAEDEKSPAYKLYQKLVRPDFYRPMKSLPLQAAQTANELQWYTLSDNGIFMSLSPRDKSKIAILLDGRNQLEPENSFFLNPAYIVKSEKAVGKPIADEFFNYVSKSTVKIDIVPRFRGRIAPADKTVDDMTVSRESKARNGFYQSPQLDNQEEMERILLQRSKSADNIPFSIDIDEFISQWKAGLHRPASHTNLKDFEDFAEKIVMSLKPTA